MTVVLARFEDLIARGLRSLLEEDRSIHIVATDVPHERLDAVLGERLPRVAMVDHASLRSPLELQALAASHPHTRLVVLAGRPTVLECNQMLAFGATACLSKDTQARDVLTAVHLASRGLQVLPRASADPARAAAPGPERLTRREAEVLDLLRRGRSNAEIALALHIGVETVRTHARSIYRKLGVSTRRELSRAAGGSGARR